MKKIDVVIPTYRPDHKLILLLERLQNQTHSLDHIILMHTQVEGEQDLLEFLLNNHIVTDQITIKSHTKEAFDHGDTRDQGMKIATGDYVLYMTQDAIPKDEYLVETLCKSLENKEVAIAYGKQLPGVESTLLEQITREFNYGSIGVIKSEESLATMGIKTYFCSNVCAMYRRETYLSLGGFVKRAIFNEDMIYAAKVITNHYKIAYVPEAKVIHGHKYTNREQLKRNFDLGVSQSLHPEVFSNVSSQSEGIKLVLATRKRMIQLNKRRAIVPMYITSAYKWIGYQFGKRHKQLPKAWINQLTMNKAYWKNN